MEIKIKGNEKVLIIQYRPVGDILLTTPVARYLKTKFPGIKISFMIYEHFYPVLQHNPYIDDVVFLKKISKKGRGFFKYLAHRIAQVRKVRKEKFDIILDYIGHPSAPILAFFSGAKYTVGYGHLTGRGKLYNLKAEHDDSPKYTVTRKYDLLKPLGIEEDEPYVDTELHFSDKEASFADEYFKNNNLDDKFNILFSPDSPKDFKKWKKENYISLGKELVKKYNARVLVLHGPGEKEYCHKIAESIGDKAVLLPDTSILEAAAIISKASLAVVNCGGMKHISIAVKTPSITLFGKTSHLAWHPPGLDWAGYIQGDYVNEDNSFGITVDDVVRKVDGFIHKGIVKQI
jgi:ADP-heptose:LPS heptosyltransferase